MINMRIPDRSTEAKMNNYDEYTGRFTNAGATVDEDLIKKLINLGLINEDKRLSFMQRFNFRLNTKISNNQSLVFDLIDKENLTGFYKASTKNIRGKEFDAMQVRHPVNVKDSGIMSIKISLLRVYEDTYIDEATYDLIDSIDTDVEECVKDYSLRFKLSIERGGDTYYRYNSRTLREVLDVIEKIDHSLLLDKINNVSLHYNDLKAYVSSFDFIRSLEYDGKGKGKDNDIEIAKPVGYEGNKRRVFPKGFPGDVNKEVNPGHSNYNPQHKRYAGADLGD